MKRDGNDGRGSLLSYAVNLSEEYLKSSSQKKKAFGQYFTPSNVAVKMANQFKLSDKIELLDPGAGTGILTAAVCDRIAKMRKSTKISLTTYEFDEQVIPVLKETLNACKERLESRGHSISWKLNAEDFVLSNQAIMKGMRPLDGTLPLYNVAISNPPYYKLKKESDRAKALLNLTDGQPNIYSLFMATTVQLLEDEGQAVFITPRSFCSGPYFKKFREWFIRTNRIRAIHTFQSREIFGNEKVLQETVILSTIRGNVKRKTPIIISGCVDERMHGEWSVKRQYDDIVYRQNGDVYIRIPESKRDEKILKMIKSYDHTLKSLNLKISTGPVVPFRTNFLVSKYEDNEGNLAPLLWDHNVQDGVVVWPREKNGKQEAIKVNGNTNGLLLKVNNYVLIKRISSKDQPRRLNAAVLLRSKFDHEYVGLENHLNYIYRPNGELTEDEAIGLCNFFNSENIDEFFRSINGLTQVNASEIRSLPFPPMEDIISKTTISRHKIL